MENPIIVPFDLNTARKIKVRHIVYQTVLRIDTVLLDLLSAMRS